MAQQTETTKSACARKDKGSSEEKLAAVAETMPLSKSELVKYCREKDLYTEQVKEWRQDFRYGFMSSAECERAEIKQAKADKRKLKTLKKQLLRKDRALAEAAASNTSVLLFHHHITMFEISFWIKKTPLLKRSDV